MFFTVCCDSYPPFHGWSSPDSNIPCPGGRWKSLSYRSGKCFIVFYKVLDRYCAVDIGLTLHCMYISVQVNFVYLWLANWKVQIFWQKLWSSKYYSDDTILEICISVSLNLDIWFLNLKINLQGLNIYHCWSVHKVWRLNDNWP